MLIVGKGSLWLTEFSQDVLSDQVSLLIGPMLCKYGWRRIECRNVLSSWTMISKHAS